MLLADIIKHGTPRVKKVTSVLTVCEAINAEGVFKSMLSEVHKLIWLFLTIPITSTSSERSFSVLKHVITYSRSSMTEQINHI